VFLRKLWLVLIIITSWGSTIREMSGIVFFGRKGEAAIPVVCGEQVEKNEEWKVEESSVNDVAKERRRYSGKGLHIHNTWSPMTEDHLPVNQLGQPATWSSQEGVWQDINATIRERLFTIYISSSPTFSLRAWWSSCAT